MSPTNPPGTVHALQRQDEPREPPRLALAALDKLALERLVTGDATVAIEHARGLAEALAGPGHDEVRLRTLSRAIALARTQQSLLDALLLERLAQRDVVGVELVEKVLRGVSCRLVKLLDAHRLESAQQRRVAVVVAHADQVNVEGVG